MNLPKDFNDDLLISDLEDIHRKKESIRRTYNSTQGMLKDYESARKKKLWIRSIAGLSAAACITIFFVFLLPSLQKITVDELYQSYYRKYSVNLDSRAVGSAPELGQAIEFYKKGQPIPALEKLESIFDDKSNPEYIFYKALFHMEAGNYDISQSGFESLIQEGGTYGSHARWYMALIDIREGNYPSARELLKEIRKAQDSTYRKRAAKLYRKIWLR